jgi:glucuronate isomerase
MGTRPFIHDDFLLQTEAARRLYHDHAAAEPICDFHCHLPPADIAGDRRFADLFEIWLEGDHYKWRAMRASGVAERFCTGDASPLEKFQAWTQTVPQTLRNPLYHWTHLELARYFGIEELLDPRSAERIWHEANDRLAAEGMSVRGILEKFQVRTVCTTDDPTDSLEHHRRLAVSGCTTRMLPTWRPDKAFAVDKPVAFNAWLDRLEAASDLAIFDLEDLLSALLRRMDAFEEAGCRLSDHGLGHCPAAFCTAAEAGGILAKARQGAAASPEDQSRFTSFLLDVLGREYARRGWAMQLHLGPLRNNNRRMLAQLGPDTGFDSIGDGPQARSLAAFLDHLDADDQLPRTILYNLNPADTYVFAAMLGNFQTGGMAGKMQLGSGWWFLDQKEGMEWQLNALSNLGLLSRFVGMVTDSRSFMSFPRHEYFRRVLCNLVGRDVENGELPDDEQLVGSMIRDICYRNAAEYLGV